MNADFLRVIAAAPEERRGLFLKTAERLGTPLQNVEKDFWVSWVLDLLFNGSDDGDLHWLLTGKGDMRAPSNNGDSDTKTEADAELVRRLMAIEGLLSGIQDDKRSAVLEEIFSRVQEAKRVADLELLVGKLARKRA